MFKTFTERVEVYKKVLTDKGRDRESKFEIQTKLRFQKILL